MLEAEVAVAEAAHVGGVEAGALRGQGAGGRAKVAWGVAVVVGGVVAVAQSALKWRVLVTALTQPFIFSYRVAVERPRSVCLPRRPQRPVVEAAVAVVLPAALGDEGVGVDALARLAVLGGRGPPALLGVLVVLLEVGGVEGLAQGQLFRVADTWNKCMMHILQRIVQDAKVA